MNRRCGLPPAELPSVAAGVGSNAVQRSLLPVVVCGAVPGSVMCNKPQVGVEPCAVLFALTRLVHRPQLLGHAGTGLNDKHVCQH
jgi:hypothetical protein